ncbi:MAG: DUF5131 family protein, partial [Planctomycetota bacterium]
MTETKRTGTLIEYVDEVLNPWSGCAPQHIGCDHCYAERHCSIRRGIDFRNERRLLSAAGMRKPFGWNRKAQAAGDRMRVGL